MDAQIVASLGHYNEPFDVVLDHLQLVRYITVAALAFNIWDFLISFSDEVQFVWAAPASLVKYLFLLNRYLGPAILIVNVSVLCNPGVTDQICRNWFYLEGWGGLTVVVVVQIILVLRVTALYERSVPISRILILLLLAHIAAAGTILGIALKQLQPLRYIGPVFLGCVTPSIPPFFFSLFIPSLVVETTLFTMTVARSMRNLPKGSWYSVPMLVLLLRDGTIYFFAMFVVTAVNTFTWHFAPPSLMKISISPMISLSSVAGCRIILNLRALHEENARTRTAAELNITTFDLGDLELHTIPRTVLDLGGAHPERQARRGTPERHKSRMGKMDDDPRSCRTTMTMVENGFDVEGGEWMEDDDYIDEDGIGPHGARRGKWTAFQSLDAMPSDEEQIQPRIESIQRSHDPTHVVGRQTGTLDIRRTSQPPPAAPALSVPPSSTRPYQHNRGDSLVHTRALDAVPERLPVSRSGPAGRPAIDPSPQSRFSSASSGSGDLNEQSPLSPQRRPPDIQPPVWRLGRIAHQRD